MTPWYNSDFHSTHPNVIKAQPSLFLTTWFCRTLFSSAGVYPLLGSALSGNPSLSCMLLATHSASLVGIHWRTGWCLQKAYSSHTCFWSGWDCGTCAAQQEMHVHRWQLELPTPSMASEGPDQASLSHSGCDWCSAQVTIN